MQINALKRGPAATPLKPLKGAIPANGMLLALDGRCMDRQVLQHALELCRSCGSRLDILLLNPPKPATSLLGQLLQKLEAAGIDYRLSSGEGDMADELPRYVHRFGYISFVVMDCLDKWEVKISPTLQALRHEGYTVMALIEPDKTAMLASAVRAGVA